MLVLFFSMAFMGNTQDLRLWNDFKNPPNDYRPVPFWHLNGTLTTSGISDQLNNAYLKDGFGGVAILPVSYRKHKDGRVFPATSPVFLSDEYFRRYREILNISKQQNRSVILYDDLDFPSGNAGFTFVEKYPELSVKQLSVLEYDVEGEKTLHQKIVLKGKLMGTVALNMKTKERIDIITFLKDSLINWTAPPGLWKVMIFFTEPPEERVVDYMNPSAVDTFLSMTYKKYDEQLSPLFGNTIKYTFSDDVGFWTFPRAWTEAMNSLFEKRTGLNALLSLPALFYNIGDNTEAIKIAFFDIRSELMSEGFNRKVAEWDAKHLLKSMIHPPGNYEPTGVGAHGDILKYYKYTQIPLMDVLSAYNNGRPGFKLISSAADLYDRSLVAAEIYGNFSRNMDSTLMYKVAMDVFARGANYLIPHGMWYNPDSMRIPPLISSYSKRIGSALPGYNNWAARSMLMLRGGSRVSEIAVMWPINTLEAWFGFENGRIKKVFNDVPPQLDYRIISDMLTGLLHRDFTYVHPEKICTDQYLIKNGKLILNNKDIKQTYSVIILPSLLVESYKTMQKLLAFYQQGGKIIATGILPDKSAEIGKDQELQDIVREIFGVDARQLPSNIHKQTNAHKGMAVFLPKAEKTELEAVLSELIPSPDLKIEAVPGLYEVTDNPLDETNTTLGMLSYIHKEKDGKQIYYFTNSTNKEVNTMVTVRGKLQINKCNPYTGKVELWENCQYFRDNNGISYTRFPLRLVAVSSLFAVSK
ncbi:MAG: glycosyl hydrolase [Prolixibacteraceae bacterium]